MNQQSRCCEIKSMCGRGLYQGVIVVGFSTIAISSVVLLSAVSLLGVISSQEIDTFKTKPVMAINFILALVATSISCYQIIVSALLLYQAFKMKGNIFLSSLWYVSHMSILTLYFLLFFAKIVICLFNKLYLSGAFTALAGIVYEGVFIYFSVIVNSYLHSLKRDRYF